MNAQTDQQLLRGYAGSRSEAAFAELVRRHVDLVYSAALRMVCDSHQAEDVTQGVFVALAQNARQLTHHPVLSGWLHRTTQNLAANAVRTNVRRQRREQEAAAMNELLSAGSDVSWEYIAPHLDAALGELSEADRDALLLRYFERKSAQEMAQVLGVSDEAAQKRVSRAVERLREFFTKRGITVGASGLVVVISANAVQAAPVGLASTISTAADLAGTTLTTTATATATKAIAMTTLQKVLVGAILVAAVGTGIYEARKAAAFRKQSELPRDVGRSVVIEIPGLPVGAKKLEFVLVPGRGGREPFFLGKYEVTQGQYEAMTHTNPSTFKKGPDYPVEQTSWQDAKDFCVLLNATLPANAKMSVRLPTDEEWSIAVGLPEEVEGTLKQKSNKIRGVYPWGTGWPPPNTAGNYSDESNRKKYGTQMSYVPDLDDGFEDTAPVGSFPANQFGLYDMGGNVWEWCEEFVDEKKNKHVVRGAGWFTHSESQLLSAYRGIPPTRNFASGFRLKLDAPVP